MDTEKKPKVEPISEVIGDIVISGATLLAHSAAEAVVSRVKRAAKKSPAVKKAEAAAKSPKNKAKRVEKKAAKKAEKAILPKKKTKKGKKAKR
jgi:hypothetical protein